MKTKINSHGDEVTDFYDKKISKLDSNHTYLAIINLDSVLQKIYYLQMLLKEFKYFEQNVDILMILGVIFLILLMSMLRNELERVKFFL